MHSMTRALRAFAWTAAFAAASAAATTEHAHHSSPYAHGQSAEVASLSEAEVRALRNGEGMGLARAAELNHFPGPKHLLELASSLGLDDAQVVRIEEIHAKMKSRAVAKGEEIIDAERHLAHLFASGHASVEAVTRASVYLGELRGALQAIHLVAHIEAARELSAEQVAHYDHLRGYRH